MGGEPWCFDPEQIARLTDWQVMHLYLKPAMERTEQMRKDMEKDRINTPGYQPQPGEPGREVKMPLPSLEQILAAAERLGIDPEKARAGYENAKGS